jgi:hypothetical protein
MTRTKSNRSRPVSDRGPGLIPPEELFLRPGEEVIEDSGPPLTEEERFRERVATAWAWFKATRFREEEHERLAEVLGEMILQEGVNG